MLVHLPIAADVGLDKPTAARFRAVGVALAGVGGADLVTGAATLPLLASTRVAADRVALVEPGTDAAPAARGTPGGTVHLLSVATLNPGKGHDVLLQALARVPPSTGNSRAPAAPRATRSPPLVCRRWRNRWACRIACDSPASWTARRSIARYDAADVFVLATRQETYGMAVAEALARGLPVVSTRTGAIPALVGPRPGWWCHPEMSRRLPTR